MATKQNLDPEVAIENALGKTELFFQRNSKLLLTILVVIVVAVGGYFGYKYLYQAPRAEKASEMMFVAQQLFAEDQFDLALEGDGNNAGFLEVIERYGSTPEGNLANHYAGICYLRTGDLDNALKYLHRYASVDGAPGLLINAQNHGLQGDIYVQLKDNGKAVEAYEKAVKAADNVLTTPYYLKKLGLLYEQNGAYDKAVAAYRRIADDYPTSLEARDIEKYIGQAEQR